MQEYVELEHNGKKIYTEKKSDRKYIFTFVRDCTDEENHLRNHDLIRNLTHGQHVMRQGYYKVKEISKIELYGVGVDELVANVAFKEKLEDYFVDIDQKMRLQPLFNYKSHCDGDNIQIPKDYYSSQKYLFKQNPAILIGRTIEIFSVDIEPFGNLGDDKTYSVHWAVDGSKIQTSYTDSTIDPEDYSIEASDDFDPTDFDQDDFNSE